MDAVKNQKIKFKSISLPKHFLGEAPSVFVGAYGYPNLNVGILSPPEISNTQLYDNQKYWGEHNFGRDAILNLRSQLVNSRFKSNVKTSNKFVELTKELSMAKMPADIEIDLCRQPRAQTHIYRFSAPTGPNAKLEKVSLSGNLKIDTQVQKIVDSADLTASEGLAYLYNRNFEENFLAKILSVGNLGLKIQRKLVPSKWAITAVYDTLGKSLISKIKDYNEINYSFYLGDYLGNYYLVLFMPGVWSYEIFESYIPANYSGYRLNYGTDSEMIFGRDAYAQNVQGGYYSVRLAVLEHLNKIKKLGSVLVFRFITAEYENSLGVWVTAAAARKSMSVKPLEFTDLSHMIKYACDIVKQKFGYNLKSLLNNSKLYSVARGQTKLNSFFRKNI